MTINDFLQGLLQMAVNLWPVIVGGAVVTVLDRMETK